MKNDFKVMYITTILLLIFMEGCNPINEDSIEIKIGEKEVGNPQETGELLWEYLVDDNIRSLLSIFDGQIFFTALKRNVIIWKHDKKLYNHFLGFQLRQKYEL